MFDIYKLEMSNHDNDNNKILDKSYIKFVGISASYTYCAKQFSSNNKLYKHICEDCPSKNQKNAPLAF